MKKRFRLAFEFVRKQLSVPLAAVIPSTSSSQQQQRTDTVSRHHPNSHPHYSFNRYLLLKMGAILDTPHTDKTTENGTGNDLRYGVCSMQGWRVEMEDAHCAQVGLPDLDDWSFFAGEFFLTLLLTSTLLTISISRQCSMATPVPTSRRTVPRTC